MLCAVYKSVKKDGAYLYVQKRDDFSSVPAALLQSFGTPQLVTLINLASREHLANADIDKVKQQLAEQGFYLQFPPPVEDLLAQHKRQP
ncbi:YcgL domain-containing protein [Rheinheimera muenzenbergensis]|uniref:YcgL domain-containing protein n=1 Tax=Rheinheimera muenzenbergensis TaxID=1193628 RepID=UPI0030010E93